MKYSRIRATHGVLKIGKLNNLWVYPDYLKNITVIIVSCKILCIIYNIFNLYLIGYGDNMIKNLNELTFKNFGTIINNNLNQFCNLGNPINIDIQEYEISSSSLDFFYFTGDMNIIINPSAGISLLCVFTQPASCDISLFLLDKTVCLNKNLYYNIIPMYKYCKIQIAHNKLYTLMKCFLPNPISYNNISPSIDIKEILTLFYQDKGKGFKFKGEKHDFWEFTYVDYGVLHTSIDNKLYNLRQGEAIFYGKNQYHSQWSGKENGVCFVTISFIMDFENPDILTNNVFQFDNSLKKLVDDITYEFRNAGRNYYSSDLMICYFKEIIIKLIRNRKSCNFTASLNTDMKQHNLNSLVLQTVKFINENINKKINMDDISSHIHISKSYLSTIFKENMGITIINYINNFRLEKSKELIRSTGYNFTQIAQIAGFKSVHYFSRLFKSKFGITPTEYAKSIRK